MDSFGRLVGTQLSQSDPGGKVWNGNKCGDIPAIEAIIFIITAGLVDELRKKEPFGPNNEIMKALHAAGDFIQCIFGCR